MGLFNGTVTAKSNVNLLHYRNIENLFRASNSGGEYVCMLPNYKASINFSIQELFKASSKESGKEPLIIDNFIIEGRIGHNGDIILDRTLNIGEIKALDDEFVESMRNAALLREGIRSERRAAKNYEETDSLLVP